VPASARYDAGDPTWARVSLWLDGLFAFPDPKLKTPLRGGQVPEQASIDKDTSRGPSTY